MNALSTHNIGDQGELAIALDCIERGYMVSFAFGQNSRYDMIVDRSGELFRLQVKTVNSTEDKIFLEAKTANSRGNYHYSLEDYDCLAIYDRRTKQCFYLVGGDRIGTITLRFTEPKNNQKKGVRWANDYQVF